MARDLMAAGKSGREVARVFGVGKSSLYRALAGHRLLGRVPIGGAGA
jgi:transposase